MVYRNSEDQQIKYELTVYLKSTKGLYGNAKAAHDDSRLTRLLQPSCVRVSLLCTQRFAQQQVGALMAAGRWGAHVHGASKGGCEL